jgi:hypothetical protein
MRFSRQSTDTGSARSHPHSHSFQTDGGGSEAPDSKRELRVARFEGEELEEAAERSDMVQGREEADEFLQPIQKKMKR